LGGACHRLLGGGGSTSVRPILVGAGLPVASVPQKPAAGNGEVVVIWLRALGLSLPVQKTT
jgi:hypothetical protein